MRSPPEGKVLEAKHVFFWDYVIKNTYDLKYM